MTSRKTALDDLPLGPVLAAGFAAALAFALYAMPGWRLAQLVVASGLPDLLPFAEPPLGETARALLMLVAAGAGGAAVWALFAWIERPRAPNRFATAPRRRKAVEPDAEAPTLRRADAHPDAPARRPIFAAEDLGAPLDTAAWAQPTPPVAAEDTELLLETAIEDADFSDVLDAEPATAKELMARLETGLARRATPPRPDARLRDAFARAANG